MRIRSFISLILGLTFMLTPANAESKVQEVVSPNGIKAWFIPEPSLPLVSIIFSFQGGTAYDPLQKQGLAAIASQMLMEGTAKLSSTEFKHYLIDNAIQVSFTATPDRLIGSLRVSLKKLPQAIEVLRDIFIATRLDPVDFERIKRNHKASLENALKNPETQAIILHNKMIVGDHPYSHFGNGLPEMLKNITSQDLRTYYKDTFNRDSLVVGVCGKLSTQELGKLLDQLFAELPDKSTISSLPEVHANFTPRRETVPTPNPQAVVHFSHPGLAHNDPDFMKLYLLNHIIGGDTSSRLWKEIREKRGLAYYVGTGLGALDKLKLLSGSLGSETTKVNSAIQLVQQVWQEVKKDGVTQTELDNAKAYMIGAFPMNFTSSISIANVLHSYQRYGLNPDYMQKRAEIINAITLQDINAFARKFIDPNKLVFTIAGNPTQSKNKAVQ
jgi:zinc protease